jgi:hypothetical protein
VKSAFVSQDPVQKSFIDEASYAVPQVTTVGFAQAQAAFDAKVQDLSSNGDPQQMLDELQTNASSLLKK